MGYFELKPTKNEQFSFCLKAGNHEVILTSETYTTKAACENGIASVKTNAQDEARFEQKKSSNGKDYFVLKATNGQVIGQSEMYESTAGMENGIASVMKNAPEAEVKDLC